MSDTYGIYLAKVKTCDKNIFGVKRTSKKTIIILQILKKEIRNKEDLSKAQKAELSRRISKKMLDFI